jgi:hypothetical protein
MSHEKQVQIQVTAMTDRPEVPEHTSSVMIGHIQLLPSTTSLVDGLSSLQNGDVTGQGKSPNNHGRTAQLPPDRQG